ncbi:glycosyltransferase family 39 protein [Candidatus Gottesmanbacteria bacterium]|nr:glycosyltransferase family 39 protein [Candidatus Gottesmanbacteria bacterium]
MKFSQPKNWIAVVFALCSVFIVYFSSRLYALTGLPIFTDEAIYIRWSQIGSRDASWRFISLVDGKQPLFTWIMMVYLKIFHDPLFAGRFVSVSAGCLTLIGLVCLSYYLFKDKKISFLTAILYIISPFSLMYDRLALYDSLVAALSVWSLFFSIVLARSLRLDIALMLGMTLGLGMLNKTSGFLSLYLLPMTLVLFDFKHKEWKKRLLLWFGLAFISLVISQALYGVLRLSPLFSMISQKDSVFVYPLSEWLLHPYRFLEGNLSGMFDWVKGYLTWPIVFSVILSVFVLGKYVKEKILLFLWWFVPFVGLALFGRVLYPRFIFFMVMPLLILSALTFKTVFGVLKNKLAAVLVILFCFIPSAYIDYFILSSPLTAPIPKSDKGQYIDDWPSGWGVPEVNAFLGQKAMSGKVSVYTEGTFGLMPYAIELYYVDNPNIKIKGFWPVPKTIPEEIMEDARIKPTFVVFYQSQVIPSWPMRLVFEKQKGGGKSIPLRLFEVISDTHASQAL